MGLDYLPVRQCQYEIVKSLQEKGDLLVSVTKILSDVAEPSNCNIHLNLLQRSFNKEVKDSHNQLANYLQYPAAHRNHYTE